MLLLCTVVLLSASSHYSVLPLLQFHCTGVVTLQEVDRYVGMYYRYSPDGHFLGK